MSIFNNYKSFQDNLNKINNILDGKSSYQDYSFNQRNNTFFNQSSMSGMGKIFTDMAKEQAKMTMNKAFEQPTTKSMNEPKRGDIIGIDRGYYEHYGIYIGNNRVIHYTSANSDVAFDNEIMETDMSHFMRGQDTFFVLDIESFAKYMNENNSGADLVDEIYELLTGKSAADIPGREYHIFSPEQTVARAKSILGEREYDLINNNCEHMAMWCKTGVKECNQILTKEYRIYFKYPFIIENSTKSSKIFKEEDIIDAEFTEID